MKFVEGQAPTWKGKPKSSPLDDDPDFQNLIAKITSGEMQIGDTVTLYIDEDEDAKRLGVKKPGSHGPGPSEPGIKTAPHR